VIPPELSPSAKLTQRSSVFGSFVAWGSIIVGITWDNMGQHGITHWILGISQNWMRKKIQLNPLFSFPLDFAAKV
jgi:hypothetical protein